VICEGLCRENKSLYDFRVIVHNKYMRPVEYCKICKVCEPKEAAMIEKKEGCKGCIAKFFGQFEKTSRCDEVLELKSQIKILKKELKDADDRLQIIVDELYNNRKY
tara:strand:+ start:5532 stop:5849 length:318 start_codon:yes stop_codon:yes gene_type:complete